MTKYFSRQLLYRIRNEIPLAALLPQLQWPHKTRDGRLCLLCPRCGEFLTVVNPAHELGALLPLRGQLQHHRPDHVDQRVRLRCRRSPPRVATPALESLVISWDTEVPSLLPRPAPIETGSSARTTQSQTIRDFPSQKIRAVSTCHRYRGRCSSSESRLPTCRVLCP